MNLPCLSLDMDVVNSGADEDQDQPVFGESTYRQDGVSIGPDYLRLEGSTVTRGEIMPRHLDIDSDQILGAGAFSTVRLATLKRPGEASISVAVKSFPLSESSSERRNMLLKEVKALSYVESNLLVGFHGAYLEDDAVTMVLELMDRGSLDRLLKQRGKLSTSTLAPISYQMLSGLAFLHEIRILHRDIKPGNILLDSNGNLKLCDFGMAALGEQSLNYSVLGTSKFMAPERLRARAYGKPSDVWSVGLVLLECIIGENPWHSITSLVDLVVTVEDTDMTSLIPESLTNGIREIVVGSLQKDPAKRIPPNILLKSPWYSRECGIHGLSDSTALLRKYLATTSES